MLQLKKILPVFLAIVVVLSGMFILPVDTYAIKAGRENALTEHSASIAAAYIMNCQPDDAIVLSDTVTITAADITDNYLGGIVNLPRLASEYYYQLGGNTNYKLLESVYPALAFKTAAIGTSVTLSIRNHTTMAAVVSCTVKVTTDGSVTNGYDVYYPGSVPDCSSGVVAGLAAAPAVLNRGNVTTYDHALHKTSIVMDSYILKPTDLVASDIVGNIDDFESSTYNLDQKAYVFKREDVGMSGIRTSYNIKDYIGTLNSSAGLRSGVIAAGSKIDDNNVFDNNTGLVQTQTLATDVNDLYYIIALSTRPYIGKISTSSVDSDAFTAVDNNAPKMSWYPNINYNLESGSLNGGYVNQPDPSYLAYGPISFEKFWSQGATHYGLSLRTGKYMFKHNSSTTSEDFNLYAETLIYAGCIPHLSTTKVIEVAKSVTINYYMKASESTTFNLAKTETVAGTNWAAYNLLAPTASEPGYEFDGWYTDNTLKTAFNKNNYNITGEQVLNLYGTEKYAGATYTVTYYNTQTAKDISTGTYKVIEKPVPPAVTSNVPGYSFKGWLIVERKTEETGTTYNATTFAPVANKNYIFQTTFASSGIIANVQTDVEHFYVGDTITKDHLRVYVIDNEGANQRLLSNNEYTISNEKLTKVGSHSFVVTYTKTGATATTTIQVESVDVIELSAKYIGGSLPVGSDINLNTIELTVTYNNGTKQIVKDFSISPRTIQNPGDNSITVTYDKKTTSVLVPGTTKEEKKTLSKIKAQWIGTSPTVGDTLNPADLLVVASYTDGTDATLSAGAYKYSPSKFKTAGKNTITVTYGGKKTSCKVTVKKKESSSTSSSTGGGSSTGSGSVSNSGSASGNSSSSGGSSSSSGQPDNSGQSAADALANLINSIADNVDNNGSSGSSSSGHNTTVEDTEDITEVTSEFGDVASPLYLAGATILTNTMTSSTAVSNTVDIDAQISNAAEGSNVTILLINGASGNDITGDVLNKIKSKDLHVNVHMLASSGDETVVAKWVIKGSKLDNIQTFNPNIVFDVADRSADRLIYFTTSSTEFPKGVSLKVIPESDAYASGALIRMYETDLAKSNSKLAGTLSWKDSDNEISIDLDLPVSHVLSDSMESYPDGSNFSDTLNDMGMESDATVNDDTVIEDDSELEDEEEVPDDFWDDDSEEVVTVEKKTLPILPIIIILCVLLIGGGVFAVLKLAVFNKSKAKPSKVNVKEEPAVESELEETVPEIDPDTIGEEIDVQEEFEDITSDVPDNAASDSIDTNTQKV